MLNVTKLLCDISTPGDDLRYEGLVHGGSRRSNLERRPVVVWNLTRRCNLHCIHCYAEAQDEAAPGELTHQEGKALIDDLAVFKAPVLLFSGGEPLLRPDLFELAGYAVANGLRAVLSTNGILITPENAQRIKEAGFTYVGVSLDGLEPVHDRFRGKKGAFRGSLAGMHNCQEAGVRVGIRLTLTRHNFLQIRDIFRLMEAEGITRLCFYHLAYAGRGSRLVEHDLSPQESRQAMDTIFQETVALHSRLPQAEVLTVDNHADSVYLYLKMKGEQPERAAQVLRLLEINGGNASGIAIAAVDDQGEVHPDQFWRHCSLGNIRERPLSQIWQDTSHPILGLLKERAPYLKGRCGLCQYQRLCNGNLRVRAEAVYGDIWAPDPACYLTDEEIGVSSPALAV
ncbi:MAG: radical SAM protein [Chloroflexi bacterium]|nr:radical SAM protein [Chloroflexota bacterium]